MGRHGALERIRTSDPQLRKLVLYPLSYERVERKDTCLVLFHLSPLRPNPFVVSGWLT